MIPTERLTLSNRSIVQKLEAQFRENKLSTQGLTRVVDRTSKVVSNNERVEALKRIFGPQINMFAKDGTSPAENIMLDLFDHIFDQGTNRDTECHIKLPDGSLRVISEPAVPIHSRSSFITAVQLGIVKNADISIGMIDLARFRDADFTTPDAPQRSVRSADVIANKTARAIRTALKDVWQQLHLQYEEDTYEVGRYGGDEFVIALAGKNATAHREVIMKVVQRNIEEQQGYYRGANGEIELENIQLKKINERGDVIEWLSPPDKDNSNARKIYLDYLGRGLLLNEAEFNRILDKYTQGGVINMAQYQEDYEKDETRHSIYPPGTISIDDRIKHLINEHPEFEVYFRYLDTLGNAPDVQKTNKGYLISIIENSIFDRLLGDFIYSRSHFAEHIRNGEIDKVHVIDFKFLKEINSDMTYADSDKEIKKLWKTIKDAIPQDQRKNIIVSRFAGAFYIGVKKGGTLNSWDLENITTHTLFDDDAKITVPLGTTKRRIRSYERREANKLLTTIENDSDARFYLSLFTDISKEQETDPTFITQMGAVDIHELANRKYAPLKKSELYAHMLRGKRTEARVNKLVAAFQHEKDQRLRKILENSLCQLSIGRIGKKTILQKSEYVQQQIKSVNNLFTHLVTMVRAPVE